METHEDLKKFREMISVLAELHQREISATLLEAYYEALKEYPIKAIETAGKALLKSSRFFPKPADFIDEIDGTDDEQAEDTWEKALAILYDPYASFIVERNIAVAIESLGGREYIGGLDQDELRWIKKDFIKIYKSRPHDTAPVRTVGFFENNNSAKGFREFIPVPIDLTDRKELPEGKKHKELEDEI